MQVFRKTMPLELSKSVHKFESYAALNISTHQKSVCQNRSICLPGLCIDAIHITTHRQFFRYWQCYLCLIVHYSSVKNSKAHIFILLKLCYICWGSPEEHFAVCLKRAGRKTKEIQGVEVDQSSSTIFGHMVAGNA